MKWLYKFSISAGRIFGIPIRFSWSYLFIVGMVLASFGLIDLLSITFLIVAHELGHALVANRKYNQKVESIIFTGFGGAAIIDGYLPSPKGEVMIFLAGPAANIVLAALAAPLLFFPILLGHALYGHVLFFVNISLMLGLFNLIPVLPLDGGRILRGLLRIKFKTLESLKYAAISGIVATLVMLPVTYFIGAMWVGWILLILSSLGWYEYIQTKKQMAEYEYMED